MMVVLSVLNVIGNFVQSDKDKYMKWEEYIEKASRTDAPLDTKELHDIHMVVGMSTEINEILDVFKKKLAYNKPVDWVNVKEEIGDIMWYLANFCRTNNFNLQEILDVNIEKLKCRYPERFSEDNAIFRNIDAERSILENHKI